MQGRVQRRGWGGASGAHLVVPGHKDCARVVGEVHLLREPHGLGPQCVRGGRIEKVGHSQQAVPLKLVVRKAVQRVSSQRLRAQITYGDGLGRRTGSRTASSMDMHEAVCGLDRPAMP